MNNHTLILITIMILMLPITSASFTNEWGESQDNPARWGFVNDESAQFNTTGIFVTVAEGNYFSPLLIDADADGTKEIIYTTGSYVKIRSLSSGVLSLEDEFLMESTQTVAMTSLPLGYDSDDYREFIVISNSTNFTILEYNGTSINIECTNRTSSADYAVTGIVCINYTTSQTACWWGTNSSNVIEMNPNTCGYAANDVGEGGGGDTLTVQKSATTNPPIADFDNDGHYEIAFGYDHARNNEEDVMVYDTVTAGPDSTFSTDGIYDLSKGSAQYIYYAGSMFYNIDSDMDQLDSCYESCKVTNPYWWYSLSYFISYVSCLYSCDSNFAAGSYGGGTQELFVTYRLYGGASGFVDDSYMLVLKKDGSTLWSAMTYDDSSDPGYSYAGLPFIVPKIDDTTYDDLVCAINWYDSTSTDLTRVSCYNSAGTLIFRDSSVGGDLTWYTTGTNIIPNVVAARFHSIESDNFDFVVGGGILKADNNDTTMTKFIDVDPTSYALYSIALADVTDDGMLDVCGSYTGLTFCAYSLYENQPPELFNSNLSYGGYGYDLDISSPLCINTSVNFQAQECYPGVTSCNYENDFEEDFERIKSNCGQNIYGLPSSSYTLNASDGDYAGSNPVFSCYYNNTGLFNVRLYLQDNNNDDDVSVYNTQSFVIHVINGVPGVTCNIAPSAVLPGSTPITTAAAADDVFDDVWDEFGITSTTSKAVIGIAVVIGIIIAVAQLTVAPLALAAAGLFALIIVTFMGLVSAYILILCIIGLVLMYVVVGKTTGSSGG